MPSGGAVNQMIVTRMQHGFYATNSTFPTASAWLPNTPEANGLVNVNLKATGSAAGINYLSTGMVFRIADIPGYTDLSSLFESYKILSATVTMIPRSTASDMGSAGNTTAPDFQKPTCFYAVDTEGQFANANLSNLMQYGGLKQVDALRTIKFTVVPKVAQGVQYLVGSNLTIPQATSRSWIAFSGNQSGTQGANVDHWGAVVAWDFPNTATANSGPTLSYDVYVKYKIALKRVI